MFLARSAALAALACSCVAALAVPASAATTITTGTSSTNYTCQWGYPNTATYGETITVPATDPVLDSFSFYVTQFRDPLTGLPSGDPATITYRAYVYAWDGTKATGPSLWESAGPQTVTTSPGVTEVNTSTGGVALAPGGTYVLFLSVSQDYASNTTGDRACWMNAQNQYAGGVWAFLNNGGDTSQWTGHSWSLGSDVAFTASFSGSSTPIYDFDGFYRPIENRDESGHYILNQVRAGSAIPVKFSLGGDQGLDIFAAGYPSSQAIACDSQAEVNGVEETVNAGGSSLSYDPQTDTYTYVWKTSKAWADSCRQLVVKLADGTTARADFALTK